MDQILDKIQDQSDCWSLTNSHTFFQVTDNHQILHFYSVVGNGISIDFESDCW